MAHDAGANREDAAAAAAAQDGGGGFFSGGIGGILRTIAIFVAIQFALSK